MPPGDVEIVVTTIGYGLARKTVRVAEGMPEVEIRVGQEALKRTEEVVVEAPPFDPVDPAAPADHSLRGVELRNLGGVLTDDPLRSVQSLPGVATGDDFYASFATRGSGFSTVGFYLDGVLMSAPFHTIRDINDAYSLTILNGDVVESLSLVSGGAPARYGDRTGAVLDVQHARGQPRRVLRPGQPGRLRRLRHARGPARRVRRRSPGSLSARKSYLDYVLDRIDVESGTTIGYYDVTSRLAHHPTPAADPGPHVAPRPVQVEGPGDEGDPAPAESAQAGSDLAVLHWRRDTARRGAPPSTPSRRARPAATSTSTAERPSSRTSSNGRRADGLARGWGRTGWKGACSSAGSDERATAARLRRPPERHAGHRGLRRVRRAVGRLPAGHVDGGEPAQPHRSAAASTAGRRRARAACLPRAAALLRSSARARA